jgi:YVTN family beta-propeller protein
MRVMFLKQMRVSALLAITVLCGCGTERKDLRLSTTDHVGRIATNRYYTPANQLLTPAGMQVELPGMRPQAIALSPDGRLLVTAGKTHELVVLDSATGKILQRVPLPSNDDSDPAPESVSEQILNPDKEGQLSFTGLVFSPDASRIYLSNVQGNVKVFSVREGKVSGSFTIRLPRANAPNRKAEIPAGIAVSKDGKRIYVAFDLSNRMAELEASTGKVLRNWEVGVAPFGVVLAKNKAYVSNWGGRLAGAEDRTGPAGHGTSVRVDSRYIASEGTVSVIDLGAAVSTMKDLPRKNEMASTILTGLHASAMALSPDERWLVVANAGSDTLSVIDTSSDKILETIWARQNPADLFGAQPNALTFDSSGRRLFVCNGTQNAVAVFDFDPGKSTLRGLIPVGWFPGAIAYDAVHQNLCVANIKGIGATRYYPPGEKVQYNSHQSFGTLSLVQIPNVAKLKALTAQALANMRYPLLQMARMPARAGEPVRPVPERAGEPSVFKHVIYMIKENRTYDQVLGDIPEGNGDASLCVFGERITPNLHKVARDFVLLDNTYCSGVCSADGHQWADSAMVNEYLERSFAGFPRSYVHGMTDGGVDALAYSSAGFIWDNALAHGKTLRDYGEFAITEARWKDRSKTRPPKFLDYYKEFTEQTGAIEISCRPAIESLRPYLVTNTVGWALNIPDVFRASQFIRELKRFEEQGGFPDLCIICLPNDHTSGTRAGFQTPAAMVADHDLAFGRILEAVSHSKFWKDTCVFGIEDDPQAGWDHVSGYRTTCYVASPYTRRHAVVNTQYNQTSLLRTIELILGLPPMNQMDATATPMSDCFTATPDFSPYDSVPNNVPLDQTNPEAKTVLHPLLRKHAVQSARLRIDEPDKCPEDVLNRILWHAMKGPEAAYPEWAVMKIKDEH